MKTKKRFWIFAASALAVEAVLGASLAIAVNSPPKAEEVVRRHSSYMPWVEVVDDGTVIHASSEAKMIDAVGDFDDTVNEKLSSGEIHITTAEEVEEAAKKGVTLITLVEEETDAPYKLYSGSFDTCEIAETSLSFLAPPTTFGCIVGYNKAIMAADSAHENNFKKSSVTVTYTDGTVYTEERSGTGTYMPVSTEKHNGTLSKAVYTLTMYTGESESSEILEQAVITFTRN